MAVGVPEHEVFAAADRVLARGERPTVERVRAELGRGSPARVGSLLEIWWEALAQRLAGESRLPELPSAVAEAFRAAWASAIEHGTALAQAAIADTTDQLTQERAQLAADRDQWQAAVAVAQAAEHEARQAAAAAEVRLRDRQAQIEQQSAVMRETQDQRDAIQARQAALESALEASRQTLVAQAERARQERVDLQQHIRAVEDRAHADVDQARQELKAVRLQLQTVERAASDAARRHTRDLGEARAVLAMAQQELVAERARAETLAAQLQALGDLPAALQATLAQVGKQVHRSPARKRIPRPSKA